MNCDQHDHDVLPGCGPCILSLLKNLLARIHGDGGHYTEWHGIPASCEAAHAKVSRGVSPEGKLVADREAMKLTLSRIAWHEGLTLEDVRAMALAAVNECEKR